MTNGVNVPTSRTALRSFNKLVAAAEKMFYTKGYFNTTIGDIVKEADVGIGTFYIYFENKYPLYEYIINKYERELKDRLAESIEGCKTRLDAEIAGIRAFIRHAHDNPTCYNLIWESLYINKDLFYGYYQRFSKSYSYALNKASDQLADNVDIETLVYSLMGISNFVGLQAITCGELTEEKLDAMCATIRTMLGSGVFRKRRRKKQTPQIVE
ncbi:MAG: TetR/AcrR family transcriptional regulator [Clostridia bacterium]|nr:TetR/AcrR family transcriptional regulator [Clostridia bacterium]